jgi:hypothetical protein
MDITEIKNLLFVLVNYPCLGLEDFVPCETYIRLAPISHLEACSNQQPQPKQLASLCAGLPPMINFKYK